MSQQGMVIDSLEFARQHGALSGRLDLARLSRLAELLFDTEGSLAFTVSGGVAVKASGDEAFLALSIEGTLRLTCQRCLGALDHPVRIRGRLLLVRPGAPWPDEELEDDDCDAIEAAHALDLAPLLEEEILLALPIAPRHGECAAPEFPAGTEDASPFAKLARLKR